MCSDEHCLKPRVLILYLDGLRLRCRRCMDLGYPSQYQSDLARAKAKTQRALRRLGVDSPTGLPGEHYPGKPRGMHHRTFVRLGREYLQALHEWARLTQAYEEACRATNIAHLEEMIEENRRDELGLPWLPPEELRAQLLAKEDATQHEADSYPGEDEDPTV